MTVLNYNSGLKYPRIDSYVSTFHFAQAKKYLSLKGPICLEIITDSIYPLLRFGEHLVITELGSRDRAGKLGVFLSSGQIKVGFIKSYEDKVAELVFSKISSEVELVKESHLLGFGMPYGRNTLMRLLFKLKLYFQFRRR